MSTVMKLLFRCKKLYQAMAEIRKILQLILKQEQLFEEPTGIIYKSLAQYEQRESPTISQKDEYAVMKAITLLQKISRRISHVIHDHRLFTKFLFNGKDHQQTLLYHGEKLSQFIEKYSAQEGIGNAILNENGMLEFVIPPKEIVLSNA
jgi:hypothetical protein